MPLTLRTTRWRDRRSPLIGVGLGDHRRNFVCISKASTRSDRARRECACGCGRLERTFQRQAFGQGRTEGAAEGVACTGGINRVNPECVLVQSTTIRSVKVGPAHSSSNDHAIDARLEQAPDADRRLDLILIGDHDVEPAQHVDRKIPRGR